MVKLSHLKPGDIVHVLDESIEREGVVVGIDRDEDLVCIDNGIQEFWYPRANIRPLPLTEERLVNTLGFEKEEGANGSVKYKKGAFRVLIHDPGNNTHVDVWYREDRRQFHHPLYVHELQNHHLEMTKVPLDKAAAH